MNDGKSIRQSLLSFYATLLTCAVLHCTAHQVVCLMVRFCSGTQNDVVVVVVVMATTAIINIVDEFVASYRTPHDPTRHDTYETTLHL